MTTTLPLMMPSLTPTSSPTGKANNYNATILSLNNNQNTTPISSILNSNKTPITPDSCSSSSYNKLPKIKLILKLPSSSPKVRSNKNNSSILHKPINMTPSASSANLINKNLQNSSSRTILMIDKIMNTIFDTKEILLKNKINDSNQYKSKKSSIESTKSKVKDIKLRKVRTTSSKIKKTPVKSNTSKKNPKKRQSLEIFEEIETKNTISSTNTIKSNILSETEIETKKGK
jgi:hypothetical protein